MRTLTIAAMLLLVVLGWGQPVYGQGTALRFVHAAYDVKPVNVDLSGVPFFLKRPPLSASSLRTELPALTYNVQILDTPAVDPDVLHSTTLTLTDGLSQSLVLMGRSGNLSSLVLSWDKTIPQLGNVKLRFVHAASSVSSPLSVLVNGSVFVLSVNQYNASGFIEVPLSQAANISFAQASSGAQVAKFSASGAFEADNVYTIYFIDSPDGQSAQVVNETSIDEQVPMPVLQRVGTPYTVRAVHVSSNSPTLGWDIGSLPVFSRVPVYTASATHSVFADAELELALYPEGAPQQVLAEQTVTLGTEKQVTLVAYNLQSDLRVLSLPWNGETPASGQARIRVVNTTVGLAQASVYNASEQLLPPVLFGQATAFKDLQAQPLQLRIRNEVTQSDLVEVSFTPSSQKVYTLFLANGSAGTEVRVMEETNAQSQEPLLLLNMIVKSQAQLRVVNLSGNTGQALRVQDGSQMISDRIQYASTDPVINAFPLGSHNFTATDADVAGGNSLVQVKGDIENDRGFLLLFAGPFDDASGWLYPASKGKVEEGNVNIRFIHAMHGQKNISVFLGETGEQLAKTLAYGNASSYVVLSAAQHELRLKDENGQELGVVAMNMTESGAITIFFVREGDHIAAYVLPDDSQEAFNPMTKLDVAVSVESETAMTGVQLSTPFPHPIEEISTVTVSLPVASSVALQLTDLLGKAVWQMQPQWYAAGSHTLQMERNGLQSGMYFLHLHVGNQHIVRMVRINSGH